MKIVNIVCRAAVTVTLLLTFSASSWGQTSLDNAPVGSQAADEAARARGGPVQPVCRRDTTPHKVTFVEVEPGVKLEVLDWGGSGEVMVLLTGAGDNAHVFDYFAFQFTDFFHVIGITRRGWLPSSQPKNGYDVETRAADDIAVLDALGIRKAVFVGHSIAGAELSKIGAKYPSYVDKLVYLDASDLSERNTFPDIPGPFDLFTDADGRSLFALQAAYARLLAVREPIPAICLSFAFDKDGMVTGTSTPESIIAQLSAGVNIPAIKASGLRKRNGHEEERVAEKQVSFSADRRENQGARRLAGQDAQPAPCLSQGSRSRSRRGVEVERGSGVVARRIDLHRRDL